MACLSAKAQRHTETGFLIHGNRIRSYEVFIPGHYDANNKYPLVLVLHGGGGNAKRMIRYTGKKWNDLASKENFIVIYPNGVRRSWNDGPREKTAEARQLNIDDVGFIERLINNLAERLTIDLNNVFVCGISNGGFMAQRLAFELSHKIKGIGVVAANLSVVQAERKYPERPVPVIFISGTNDPLVPYHGGYVTVFNQRRGKVLSMNESLKIWRNINNCGSEPDQYQMTDRNKKDKCKPIKRVWSDPYRPGIRVVEIRIENGGHTWPGCRPYLPEKIIGNTNFDINGCEEIWSFFKSLL